MSFADYLAKGYLPDLGSLPESEIAERVLSALDPHFEARREVCGTHCSGRRLRIDAVLWPRDPARWHDEKPVFAVEFKRPVGQGAEALGQCADYAHTRWDGYGHLPVFLCPAVVSRWAWGYGGLKSALIAQLLMGQLAVGELDRVEWRPGIGNWRMERAGSRIWDSHDGPARGGVSSLAVKVGNRSYKPPLSSRADLRPGLVGEPPDPDPSPRSST